jgi:pimeloyl-ACP methyl ester carboxylesterase
MIYDRPFRAKFTSGIVAEFMPPIRRSGKVVIICDGLPSMPAKRGLLRHLSKNGFWGVHLRYRGTWESEGVFLRQSPSNDIDLLVDHLGSPIVDIWSGKIFHIRPKEIVVIGSSFGGAVTISSSTNRKISKAIALAPVCDWRSRKRGESKSELRRVIAKGFGPVYRFSDRDWQRLVAGKLFNPASDKTSLDPAKLLLIHAVDDSVVHVSQSEDFAARRGVTLKKLRTGGHLSTSDICQPSIWRTISRFLAN